MRKVSFGVGVERTFPVHSPILAKIEVVTRGDVRRAKLYYLRDRIGKAAKIKEKRAAADRVGSPCRWRPVADDPTPAGLPPLAEPRHGRHADGPRAAVLLVTGVLIAFLLKTFVAQAFYIPSGSMVPQLEIGDRVVVSKLAYRLHDPRRGDIVVFDDPRARPTTEDTAALCRCASCEACSRPSACASPSTEEFIKRVVGLPGETVEGRNGRRVTSTAASWSSRTCPTDVTTSDFAPVTVPDGPAVGDGRQPRANSSDSRGLRADQEVDSIVGRAIGRVWPPRTRRVPLYEVAYRGRDASAEDLERYETEIELQLYKEYKRRLRDVPLRRRDRAAVLPRQRGARWSPRARAAAPGSSSSSATLGVGHVPPGPFRVVGAGRDVQGRERRGAPRDREL